MHTKIRTQTEMHKLRPVPKKMVARLIHGDLTVVDVLLLTFARLLGARLVLGQNSNLILTFAGFPLRECFSCFSNGLDLGELRDSAFRDRGTAPG